MPKIQLTKKQISHIISVLERDLEGLEMKQWENKSIRLINKLKNERHN
jgi:hypothetical protein